MEMRKKTENRKFGETLVYFPLAAGDSVLHQKVPFSPNCGAMDGCLCVSDSERRQNMRKLFKIHLEMQSECHIWSDRDWRCQN